MSQLSRLLPLCLVLVSPLFGAAGALACIVPRITPPPVIWSVKPPLRVGIEVGALFVPTVPTTCVAGIGIGSLGGPALPSLDVIGAQLTVTNVLTLQTTAVANFVFQRDMTYDVPLTNGNNGPIQGQPLMPGATWFGFSALVNPFTPQALGADEVYALWFDISVSAADYNVMKDQHVPGQFASGSADPAHPVVYFGAANPNLVAEPSSVLLVALALLALAGSARVAAPFRPSRLRAPTS